MPSKCRFWNCQQVGNIYRHNFCSKHFNEARDGQIDDCPYCHRGKYVQYDSCLACGSRQSQPARNNTRASSPSTSRSNRPYKPESSPSWEAGDAEAFEFYVYMLKLSNNEFYVDDVINQNIKEALKEFSIPTLLVLIRQENTFFVPSHSVYNIMHNYYITSNDQSQ